MAKKDTESKESKLKTRERELTFRTECLWPKRDGEAVERFIDGYKEALDQGKTERLFAAYALEALKAAGFKPLSAVKRLKAGDRVYQMIKGKGLVAAVIGTTPLTEGANVIGAHIDSPRLDLKPQPLYEANGLALLKTRYYGGIKKYQWAALPLALKGVVYTKDNRAITIDVGDKPNDPVFCVNDLLPHLGKDQMAKKASDVLEGEQMNVLFGGRPFGDEAAQKELEAPVKFAILDLLNQTYGITERDLVTAEIEVVPATNARDVGFDRAFIGAYGQDDRVCAYTALKAILDTQTVSRTAVTILYDKEEIGSYGNTGAGSALYQFVLTTLLEKALGKAVTPSAINDHLFKTIIISSDVTNAFDPTFASVSDSLNAARAGHGLAVAKYTGGRAKGGCSDASAELFTALTRLFDDEGVAWQSGELGKVEQGGGGTVASEQAATGVEVIDAGVPVFSMHSCFEVASKVDVYEAYRAYHLFFAKMTCLSTQTW